jgi:hypothetical protein
VLDTALMPAHAQVKSMGAADMRRKTTAMSAMERTTRPRRGATGDSDQILANSHRSPCARSALCGSQLRFEAVLSALNSKNHTPLQVPFSSTDIKELRIR